MKTEVVVEYTPNGREIRMGTDGKYHVQPHDDNYWITVETLDGAREAYWHPEWYR